MENGNEGDWVRFPYLTGACRSMMEDIATAIHRHLGSLLCQSRTPPDVSYFTSPRGNAEGSLILRSGANASQVKFVLGSWLHCRLGAGILNAATLIVMLGSQNDAPHFMFEIIQNDSSKDLLPRKDLVYNPDYLKTFYEETELEKYRQSVEKAHQSQVYVPSSLYVRSAVSPTAILYKFRDLRSPNDLNLLVEKLIYIHTDVGAFDTSVSMANWCRIAGFFTSSVRREIDLVGRTDSDLIGRESDFREG